jgi:hypothetical protein
MIRAQEIECSNIDRKLYEINGRPVNKEDICKAFQFDQEAYQSRWATVFNDSGKGSTANEHLWLAILVKKTQTAGRTFGSPLPFMLRLHLRNDCATCMLYVWITAYFQSDLGSAGTEWVAPAIAAMTISEAERGGKNADVHLMHTVPWLRHQGNCTFLAKTLHKNFSVLRAEASPKSNPFLPDFPFIRADTSASQTRTYMFPNTCWWRPKTADDDDNESSPAQESSVNDKQRTGAKRMRKR